MKTSLPCLHARSSHTLSGVFLALLLALPGTLAAAPAPVPLQSATATQTQGSWLVRYAIDGVVDDSVGWAIYDGSTASANSEVAAFETVTNIGYAGGTQLTFVLHQINHNPTSTIGKFRLSLTTDPRDTFADGQGNNGDVTATWEILHPLEASATDGVILTIQGDGSVLASGPNPLTTVYSVTANTLRQNITGFRLEVLEDPSLPDNGPGRFPSNGNFVLTELEVFEESIVPCPVPQRAEADAQVVNGFLVGATITTSGCGYTNPPAVLIQGGGGMGATAEAVINDGQVTGLTITDAGCCYTNAPLIIIASPPTAPSLSIAVSRVQVTMNLTLGLTYVLESTTNFVDWSATGPPFVAQSEQLTEEFMVNQTGRYFRIRALP